jgi:hypothetical protein
MAFPRGRSWRACSWQRERMLRPRGRGHEDPAFRQLSDPRSGQPLRRQSFRRSGRVPRPLSLSGLYPQFHSKFGGFPRLHTGPRSTRQKGPQNGAEPAVQTQEGEHARILVWSRLRQEIKHRHIPAHPPSRTKRKWPDESDHQRQEWIRCRAGNAKGKLPLSPHDGVSGAWDNEKGPRECRGP